jgi:putative membrane protein
MQPRPPLTRRGPGRMQTRVDPVRRSLLVLPFAVTACQGSGGLRLDAADSDFVHQSAAAGASMVALGQLAARQSVSSAVRQLAQRVVAEYMMVDRELTAITSRKGVSPPMAFERECAEAWRELSSYAGATFDQQYLAQQVQAHELQRALFRNQGREGTDVDLRAFAAKYLPVVEAHARMARALLDSVADPTQ